MLKLRNLRMLTILSSIIRYVSVYGLTLVQANWSRGTRVLCKKRQRCLLRYTLNGQDSYSVDQYKQEIIK